MEVRAMFSPKRILVPTDFSRCAQQALSMAVAMGRECHAQLHLLRVQPLGLRDPYNPLYEQTDRVSAARGGEAEAKLQMRASLEACDPDGIAVHQVYRLEEEVGPAIVGYAAEMRADLVVLGTNGRRGLRYLMLGSVAAEVVRLAHCSVLTVREQPSDRKWEKWSRILVPVDFSEGSRRALRVACALSTEIGAQLDVLHVVGRIHPLTMPDTSCATTQELEYGCCMDAQAALERLCAHRTIPQKCTQLVVVGQPADRIIHQAGELHSDLIVTATRGLSGIKRFLLGSVAEKVVRHSQCPVLTVRPHGRQT